MITDSPLKKGVWYGFAEATPHYSGVYLVKHGIYIGTALWDEGKWSTLDNFQEVLGRRQVDHWALLPNNWREHAALVREADHLNTTHNYEYLRHSNPMRSPLATQTSIDPSPIPPHHA